MTWDPAFESAFCPDVVAIVGISEKAKPGAPGGARFYETYRKLGFTGRIHLVNPGSQEIRGQKTFPSVSSIPEPVDLVLVTAPARAVPEILEDCIRAKAKNIHLFTAGFEETGEEEGRELGKQVREIAQKGGLRLLGPNCMGLYVPASRIGYLHTPSPRSGPVSFIFQSGGHSEWFVNHGPRYGIYFNKGISFGNAYVLDSTDFLEYLAADPQTEIICMYLEGVRDGRKLFRLIRETVPRKPIILWKGGLTKAGSRAAASHTGSMMGQTEVWKALYAQTGAVPVTSLEEMAEITQAFLFLKPTQGKRAAVLGMGGGGSVHAADACVREGLEVPVLSKTTQTELKKFIPVTGGSVRNPLDCGPVQVDSSLMARGMELLAADPSVDLLVCMPHLNITLEAGAEQVEKLVNFLSDFARNNPYRKPVVIVFDSFVDEPWEDKLRVRLANELAREGVAVYKSLTTAARALARFTGYHRFISRRM